MKVKLPIQKKEFVKGKLEKKIKYVEFELDFSLASQMRFEKKFPEMAQNEDLYGYSSRILGVKELTVGKLLSELKLFYCWLDTDLEFIDFLKMIDLTDEEYVKDFVKCVQESFDLILISSAEKN